MKATAIAPSNIAFVKYWGRKDEQLRLPTNGSLSMNLSNLSTTTTVEFSSQYREDFVLIDNQQNESERLRVIAHLERIRTRCHLSTKAKVVSLNSFPSGTGLSSSASGFAALTLAASKAIGLSLSEKEMTILARQGSGSACRSIPDGFVEWKDGDASEESYAYSLFPSTHWDLVDVVAVVSSEKKEISTSEGQRRAESSPFMSVRQQSMSEKLERAKHLLTMKQFATFGELIEREALEMHAVMLTSWPSLIYWTPGTLQVMKLVQQWRTEHVDVYFTINTGQDIHLICQSNTVDTVVNRLKNIVFVKQIIVNLPAQGAHLDDSHLF